MRHQDGGSAGPGLLGLAAWRWLALALACLCAAAGPRWRRTPRATKRGADPEPNIFIPRPCAMRPSYPKRSGTPVNLKGILKGGALYGRPSGRPQPPEDTPPEVGTSGTGRNGGVAPTSDRAPSTPPSASPTPSSSAMARARVAVGLPATRPPGALRPPLPSDPRDRAAPVSPGTVAAAAAAEASSKFALERRGSACR